MGLFDFFKSDKKRNAQPDNIDTIFDLASKDIAYRPLFYRTILEMDLYLLTIKESNLTHGQFIADKDTSLKIKTWEDGKVPVFTSTDKIFDNAVVTGQETYVAMKGKAIFEMFPYPTTFLLNPYSRPSKEFLPDEVKNLIADKFYKADDERTMKGGTISIGVPAKYPTELVSILKKYCDTREEIKGAYVALMHDSTSGEAPHIVIGLDLTDNVKQIFGEVGETIKPHIASGEPVDMINVSGSGNTAKILRQKIHQIY